MSGSGVGVGEERREGEEKGVGEEGRRKREGRERRDIEMELEELLEINYLCNF